MTASVPSFGRSFGDALTTPSAPPIIIGDAGVYFRASNFGATEGAARVIHTDPEWPFVLQTTENLVVHHVNMETAGRKWLPSVVVDSESIATFSLVFGDCAPSRNAEAPGYELARAISPLPEVTAVMCAVEGDHVRISTFVTRRDVALRNSIYDAELAVMEQHPSLRFDFAVITLSASAAEVFVPSQRRGRLVYYRS